MGNVHKRKSKGGDFDRTRSKVPRQAKGAGVEPNDCIYTPGWLIDCMIEMAEIKSGDCIIDPCAGDGRLIKRCNDLYSKNAWYQGGAYAAYEIRDCLPKLDMINCYPLTDFFSICPQTPEFDLAILNPPFSKLQAYYFVKELLDYWIKPSGRIIAVVPSYVLDNNDSRKRFMAKHIYRMATIPCNTFAPAATKINGYVVEFRHEGSGFMRCFDKPGRGI